MVATSSSFASTDQIRLQLRSWPEVETYLERCKGVIVPLGSTEQHGPTGAIGTDALTAEAVALEVGRRSGVLVAPAQAYGMAEHHLGFAGTMSLQPATLLAVIHDLGIDESKLNVNGGAIALGHPLGASGAKLTVQLIHDLRRHGGGLGMVTMCIGGGMGAAGIFEVYGG